MEELLEERPVEKNFLFIISNAVKVFYETSVIFFTRKDFSDAIFNTYCSIRRAILEDTPKDKLVDTITEFHLEWLRAVVDIEKFKGRMNNISREEVYESVGFTIDALCTRRKYFQRYMEKYQSSLPNEEYANMRVELQIIEEMHKEAVKMLVEQHKCFQDHSCDTVFQCRLNEAVDDLLTWLDKIYDGLALELSKILNYNLPTLSHDLTKILQGILLNLITKDFDSCQKITTNLEERLENIGCMVRGVTGHSIEIEKVTAKIECIEQHLKELEGSPSSAVEELENQRVYLLDRLASLDNIKITLKRFNDTHDVLVKDEEAEICTCEDFYQLKVFNHLIPKSHREKLITELNYLWSVAILGQGVRKHQSVISILNISDTKEIYSDDLGLFFIDAYSRKIYTKPDDDIEYQENEKHILVPLSDDENHIYFYDECGRYYVNEDRTRVYKAHATASEYMMGAHGCLLKLKEVRGDRTYYYDSFGRYYINDLDDRRIYQEADGSSEYEADGLGNLVRLQPCPKYYETCPHGSHVTEECKYLRRNVGEALKKCIARIVIEQPEDPIKYLSASLIKYRNDLQCQCERMQEKQELEAERAAIAAAEQAERDRLALEAAMREVGGETTPDNNFLSYTHMPTNG